MVPDSMIAAAMAAQCLARDSLSAASLSTKELTILFLSRNCTSRFQFTNSSWARMNLWNGMVVFRPSMTNSDRARAIRSLASSRPLPKTISFARRES